MARIETEVTFMVFAIYVCPNCSQNNKRKVYREVQENYVKAFQCNCGQMIWVKGVK